MAIGPLELLFCLFGLVIIPAGVMIAVLMRRPHLEWQARLLEGMRSAAVAALIVIILGACVVLILNRLI